jgi:hypothetical protein
MSLAGQAIFQLPLFIGWWFVARLQGDSQGNAMFQLSSLAMKL